MILSVSHSTTYHYDAPVRGAIQSLRLMPSSFDGQSVRHWSIDMPGGVKGAAFRDGAGDWIENWSMMGPVDQVTVAVTGEVETNDLSGVLRGHREQVRPEVYLRETMSTRVDIGLTELSNGAAAEAIDPLDLAHALTQAVSGAIVYRPGTTEEHTTAAEALAQGEGVCQDHAHALIAAARVRGMPARYVSGYLHADAVGQAHDAAHAWAEIWVPGLSAWVGFDPANNCCPDERYVRLGSGYDSHDAAPIRGIAQGLGAERLEVSVVVQDVEQ